MRRKRKRKEWRMVSQGKWRRVDSILETVAGIERFSGSSPPSRSQ